MVEVDDGRMSRAWTWGHRRTAAAHPTLSYYGWLTTVFIIFFREGIIVVIWVIGVSVPAVVSSVRMCAPCQRGCFVITSIHESPQDMK